MSQTQAAAWPLGRYRLKEKSYMARAPGMFEEVLPAGTEVTISIRPAPHLEPIDAEAHRAVDLAGPMREPNPARLLPMHGPAAQAVELGTQGQISAAAPPPPPPPLAPRKARAAENLV
jgi:hypothetical protein